MERRTAKSKASAPGLTYRGDRPVWRATKSAIAAGYPVKNVNLSLYADDHPSLIARCERLQTEMKSWVSGRRGLVSEFDGTIRSLIEIWQTDKESDYRNLKPSTLKPYDVYARMVIMEVGSVLIDNCDGRDIKRWFASWAEPDTEGAPRRIPKARMAIAVIRSALRFGVICRRPGCKALMDVLDSIDFEAQPSRTAAPTADDIVKMRAGAHARQHAPAALAYAIQFDGTVRQWDVIGQWVPMSDPRPSIVQDRGMKWIGPMWSQVDENLIFRFIPTKTEATSGKQVQVDFAVCPMVVEELAHVPQDRRKGPLIVNPNTGLPYRHDYFQKLWSSIRRAQKVSPAIWNRDLRAGGITEGRAAAATTDDLATLAGHADKRTTAKVYDRAQIDAARRVAAARTAHRSKPKT